MGVVLVVTGAGANRVLVVLVRKEPAVVLVGAEPIPVFAVVLADSGRASTVVLVGVGANPASAVVLLIGAEPGPTPAAVLVIAGTAAEELGVAPPPLSSAVFPVIIPEERLPTETADLSPALLVKAVIAAADTRGGDDEEATPVLAFVLTPASPADLAEARPTLVGGERAPDARTSVLVSTPPAAAPGANNATNPAAPTPSTIIVGPPDANAEVDAALALNLVAAPPPPLPPASSSSAHRCLWRRKNSGSPPVLVACGCRVEFV